MSFASDSKNRLMQLISGETIIKLNGIVKRVKLSYYRRENQRLMDAYG